MSNFNLEPILHILNTIALMAVTAVGRQCRLGHLPAPTPCEKTSVFLSLANRMRLFSFLFLLFFYILSPDEGIEGEAADGKDAVMVVSEHNNDRCRFRG